MKPLCVDLFCGLGGWSEGFLAEGYDVIGFDIERHQYWMPDVSADDDGHKHTKPVEKRGWTQGCAISLGMEGPNKSAKMKLVSYPGQLVIQDVLTLHGSQFKDAAVIVASPPCQNYSYLAMPWSRSPDFVRPCGDGWEVLNSAAAKEMREEWTREGPDNRLFDACFQIQREAIDAAGHFIPLIVENVRGANEWVSPKSRYNYGSFHLWGDVPAIMPIQAKRGAGGKQNPDGTNHPKGSWFAIADSSQGDRRAPEGTKNSGGSWFNIGSPGQTVTNRNPVHELAASGVKVPSVTGRSPAPGNGARFTSQDCGIESGTKIGGDWFRDPACHSKHGSKSNARKAASAQIAKIPFPLSEHIARVFKNT